MLAVLIIFGAIYGIIYYNYKKTKRQYQEALHNIQTLQEESIQLQSNYNTCRNEYEQARADLYTISEEASKLTQERNDLRNSIEKFHNFESSVENYDMALNTIKENIKNANSDFQDLKEKITEIKNDIEQEKANKIKCQQEAQECVLKADEAKATLKIIEKEIADSKSIQLSIVENNKREEQKRQDLKFFMLQLTSSDIKELAQLREVAQTLRNPEPLYKVIWSYYYSKPYTDLVNRVFREYNEPVCGIYKITNIYNQKCYVGQSVNTQERWRQHIKRGIGAEKATKNKLYPEMMEIGPESFTFELLEVCPKERLDEQERFWQDFYGARDFGYSIR